MPDQSSAATEHAIIQEITAPLKTLPDDPLAHVDAEFPTTMRGYDRHAVDEYVERTRRLVAELQATRSPEAAVRRALERVGDQIAGILQRAHETAEEITAQSRSEAEDRAQQARREAAHMIELAERRVRELDAETDRIWAERQRIVADVEQLSSQLVGLAREAGSRFPAEERESESAEAEPGTEAEIAPEADPVMAGTPLVDVQEAPLDEDELAEYDDAVEDEAAQDEAVDDEDALPYEDAAAEAPEPGIEETVAFRPLSPADEEDSTHVIPPSSDAAARRQRP